jgi:hypothetical protein
MANKQNNLNNTTGTESAPLLNSSVVPVAFPVVSTNQSEQSNPNVFRFSDLTCAVNTLNWPDKDRVNEFFYQENFNRLLHLIRYKMVEANTTNNNFTRILTADTTGFKSNVIVAVKAFLVNKGYSITEIENMDGVNAGWKLSW